MHFHTYERALEAAKFEINNCDIWIPKAFADNNKEIYYLGRMEQRQTFLNAGWIHMTEVYHTVSVNEIHRIEEVKSDLLNAFGISVKAVVKVEKEVKGYAAETPNLRALHAQ